MAATTILSTLFFLGGGGGGKHGCVANHCGEIATAHSISGKFRENHLTWLLRDGLKWRCDHDFTLNIFTSRALYIKTYVQIPLTIILIICKGRYHKGWKSYDNCLPCHSDLGKFLWSRFLQYLRPKKKFVMLPSPDQNLKIGSVGRDLYIFFFFFFTYRERVEFSTKKN